MKPASVAREFFERLYLSRPDPWGFADDAYELDRYRRILAAVPAGRFHTVFEPGCSIGVLTRQLAERCERVIAIDIAASAVAMARRRCADRPGVEVVRGELPADLPGEPVDLIVLSEVGYYLERAELAELGRRIRVLLRPGGRLVAAHWIGETPDHVLHGHDVHEILAGLVDLEHRHHATHGRANEPIRPANDGGSTRAFRLDVWDVLA